MNRRMMGVLLGVCLASSAVLRAQGPTDSAVTGKRIVLDAIHVVANIPLPSSPDWIGLGFGSAWVVNYRPDRVSRIDLADNHVSADIAIGRNGCLGIIMGENRVWVATCGDGVVNEIDPSTNTIIRRVPVPLVRGREGSFAVLDGAFWIPDNAADSTSNAIARVDMNSGAVVTRISTGKRSDVAVSGFSSVWVASSADNVVSRIDPATNRVVARVPVGPSPKFMATGEGAVWVQNRGDGSVSRIDPATNREVARIQTHAPTQWGDIAVGGGAVWLAVNGKPITRIDPRTNAVTHQVVGGDGADAIRFGAGNLWVADHQHGQLWRIDTAGVFRP